MLAILITCFALTFSCTVNAGQWQAFNFSGNEQYEYRVSWLDQDTINEATYILDIQEKAGSGACEEKLYEVSYTTKGVISEDQLGPETAFGLWSLYGISLNALVLNPAYGFIFAQMDLKVGEKMSMYGAGIISVPEKQTICGREGYVCQFFQGPDANAQLVAEWVIDPELALPLSSRIINEGETVSQVELVNYKEY